MDFINTSNLEKHAQGVTYPQSNFWTCKGRDSAREDNCEYSRWSQEQLFPKIISIQACYHHEKAIIISRYFKGNILWSGWHRKFLGVGKRVFRLLQDWDPPLISVGFFNRRANPTCHPSSHRSSRCAFVLPDKRCSKSPTSIFLFFSGHVSKSPVFKSSKLWGKGSELQAEAYNTRNGKFPPIFFVMFRIFLSPPTSPDILKCQCHKTLRKAPRWSSGSWHQTYRRIHSLMETLQDCTVYNIALR